MGQVPLYDTPEFRALKAALEEEWPHRRAELHATGVPLNEGDDDGDDGSGDDGSDDGDAGDGGSGDSQTFDAAYVKKLREENARHRREKQELAGRLQSFEDANKSELERAQEAHKTAEQRAAAAESAALRLEVALEKAPEGMSIQQVRKLAKRLTGATHEELEADAEELFADFAPESDDGGQGPPRGPRERLRPGAAPSSDGDDDETDPDKLADLVPRRYRI